MSIQAQWIHLFSICITSFIFEQRKHFKLGTSCAGSVVDVFIFDLVSFFFLQSVLKEAAVV